MMQKLITIFLLTLLFSAQFTEKAYAKTSLLRAIVNFFKGGADDAIRNSGKSIENILNRAGKSPEGILSKSKVNKITEMETLARDESLILENVGQETHTNYYLSLNSSRAKPIKNRKWLRDIIEEGAEQGIEEIGEEGFQEAAEKGLNKMSAENDFYSYVNINWIGRVFIRSNYYSKPKVENTILLVCKTKYEVFYFSILMEEKIKTASLVDHKSLFSTSYPTLSEQELFVLKDEDHLLSGDSIVDALKMVKDHSVECIMLNCNPLNRTIGAVKNVVDNWRGKWGVYPNLGIGEPSSDGRIFHYEKMNYYISTMKKIIEKDPFVLGACCGSTPCHIAELIKLRNDFHFVPDV